MRRSDSLREFQPCNDGSLWLHPIQASPHPHIAYKSWSVGRQKPEQNFLSNWHFIICCWTRSDGSHPILFKSSWMSVARKPVHWELWLKVDKSIRCSEDKSSLWAGTESGHSPRRITPRWWLAWCYKAKITLILYVPNSTNDPQLRHKKYSVTQRHNGRIC